jgi:hypothetical protein
MKMAKNFTLIAALTLAFASMAHAEEAAPAPEAKPDNEVSLTLPLSATTATAVYRKPPEASPARRR